MARGRFITATLGASHKLASVTDDAHRLMFVLMVTNADVEGRLDADPRILNGRVFTLMGWTLERVETGLQALADADLIRWYEIDGRPYAEIVKFHDHNSVRKDREGASNIRGPEEGKPMRAGRNAGVLQERAGSTPAQEKLSQVKTKTSTREELSSASPTRARYQPFADAWNEHCGALPRCEAINDKRKRGIDHVIRDFNDQALATFAIAVQQVAGDKYWIEQGYNIDNLLVRGRVLEKFEKHKANRGMSAGDRKLATTADIIARAIGGIDA